MINKHENISVGVIGMTSAFLAESCRGDRTQGQHSVLKFATLGVSRYLHSYYDRRADASCCVLRAPAQERGTYAAMHRYYHNNFSAKKQTRERGVSVSFAL
jgi:hypothetical protein